MRACSRVGFCVRAQRACVQAWTRGINDIRLSATAPAPLLGVPERHAPPSAGQVALLTHATPQFDEPRAIVRGAAAATLDGGARFVRKQYSYLGSGGEVR